MTKQEEIREGLRAYLKPNLKYEEVSLVDGVVYMVLDILHSHDVVIQNKHEEGWVIGVESLVGDRYE